MPPSAASSKANSTTKAGITVGADGQRIIPSSLRADGTARREIRVRPGYTPPEDVEAYKNQRAEAWKNRGSGGVPGAAPAEDPKPLSMNKNAKRRANRKKAKDGEGDGEGEKGKERGEEKKETELTEEEKRKVEEEEKEKKAKAIRKKIRQANELKSRREGGENLLPEQLDKIIKVNELVRQLRALGFEE